MPKSILILFLVFFLCGCAFQGEPAAEPFPTLEPYPAPDTSTPALAETLPAATLIPLNQATPDLSATLAPTLTHTPQADTPVPVTPSATLWYRTWTFTPTPTITLTPTLDVTTRIQARIVSPGPLSKVVSPIQFVAHLHPDYTGLTRVELIGEDGRELYRKVFKTYSNVGYFTRVEEKVTFELKGAAEMARLQIGAYDAKGNLLAYNSVRLMLFSAGENQFTPAYPAQERIGLRLKREAEITGGTLELAGEINPINDTPIILELSDAGGRIVGSRLLQLAPGDGKFQLFTTSIPYQVTERTPVRLIIRQLDDRISGLAYLYSLPIFLNP